MGIDGLVAFLKRAEHDQAHGQLAGVEVKLAEALDEAVPPLAWHVVWLAYVVGGHAYLEVSGEAQQVIEVRVVVFTYLIEITQV